MIVDALLNESRSLENPKTSLSDPDAWLFEALGAMPTDANIVVSERNATTITAFWSAVNTIADTIALLPFKLVQTKKSGAKKEVRDHSALHRLRTSPNDVMSPIVYKSTVQAHVLTWGNGYSQIVRNQAGDIMELWPLSPSQTKPFMRGRKAFYKTALVNDDANRTPTPMELPSDEVMHIPALSRTGLIGMSIVREQREMLGAALATQKFAARFFANSAKPGGLLSFAGKIRDKEKLRQHIKKEYTGDHAHGLLVTEGDAKFTPFAIPPDDAQFLQTREFSVDEIGRMFRLPLHFLNKMGQATFNNLEMMGAHFVQFTLMPWIKRWEEEATRKLLTENEIRRGLAFKINVAALVRGDIKTRSELYDKAIKAGWMTRAEPRELEDMQPIDGLDVPLVPMNMAAVGAATASNEEQQEQKTLARLVRKEVKAVRRIARNAGSESECADGLSDFYRRHQTHMCNELGWDNDQAKRFGIERGAQILDAHGTDEVNSILEGWLDKVSDDETN